MKMTIRIIAIGNLSFRNLATRNFMKLLCVFLLTLTACKKSTADFNTDEIIGVWTGLLFQTESDYDSLILNISPTNPQAILVKMDKQTVYPLKVDGQEISFKGDNGLRFEGVLSEGDLPESASYKDNETLQGVITNKLWAQGLRFRKLDGDWFTELVKPEIIDTDYQVYLEFYRNETGILKAKIQSNKENRQLHFLIEDVLFDGNDIDFTITNDHFNISLNYNPSIQKMILNYGNRGGKRSIALVKIPPQAYQGYHARVITEKYEYKAPKAPEELIETATLSDVGLEDSLFNFMDKINNEEFEHIHSVIITKNNKLVFEEYFHGYQRDDLHDIRSAFKSIASLVVGIAMEKNSSFTLDDSILDYYPQYNIKDSVKRKITVHHALTMSSGLQNEDEDKMQSSSDDWVEYKLNHPMVHSPGEKYEYSSGGMNLLSGVIQQSTPQYLPFLIQRELLNPMNINDFQMLTSPVGRGYLAGNFYLRPIDFTKFGMLVLNEGNWYGKQLVAKAWVDESTKPHIKGSWPVNSDYGYLWRLLERDIAGKKMKTIEAWGNGGQYLIIIPEINMTISFTSGNYNLFPEMERPLELMTKYILPAVKPQQ